jgi:hypothetical protein
MGRFEIGSKGGLFKFIFVPWCVRGNERSFAIKNTASIAK